MTLECYNYYNILTNVIIQNIVIIITIYIHILKELLYYMNILCKKMKY